MRKNPEPVINSKVIRFENLKNAFTTFSQKKVLVGGCFDLLHLGHVRFLRAAKKRGDSLIVALESDDFIRIKKKREPIYPQIERAEIISALTCVDAVILLPLLRSDKDYLLLVKVICPAVIAVTDNDPYLIQKEKQALAVGGKIAIVIERISLYSSAHAIHRIRQYK